MRIAFNPSLDGTGSLSACRASRNRPGIGSRTSKLNEFSKQITERAVCTWDVCYAGRRPPRWSPDCLEYRALDHSRLSEYEKAIATVQEPMLRPRFTTPILPVSHMPSAIRCSNLFKTYEGKPPVEAVRGLDLDVREGECFGLLGPNGAGKTTTIEIIEGLLEPTSGEVEVLGRAWGEQNENAIKQQIGISFQETKLSDKLTVAETLTLFRSFYEAGIDPEQVMRRVDLQEKAGSWVNKLSGGQRQRLAVACALVGDPQLLFLDEPTTGLDPQSRRQLWEIIRSFGAQGRTVLLTTHYMDEAERLCDRVAIVDRGKVIALGSPHELISGLGGEHVIEFTLDGLDRTQPDAFADLPAVSSAHAENGHILLSVSEPHQALPALLRRVEETNHQFTSLSTRHASLEDVFVTLTGRHLSDEEPDDGP